MDGNGQVNNKGYNNMEKSPFNVDLFGTNPSKEVPKLFEAPVNNRQIPEREYQSSTLGFASKFVPTPIVQPDRTGMNTIVDQDHLSKQESLKNAIRTSFETEDGVPMETKMAAATMALQVGSSASTVGQVFKQNNYPDKDSDVARTIDTKILRDDYEATVLSHLGEDGEEATLKNVLNNPNPSWTEEISNTLQSLSKESIADLATYLPEGSASRKLVERFTTSSDEGVMTAFGDADALQSGLAARMGEAILPTFGLDKDASLNDVLEFISFLPVDADAEIDVENAVKIVFSEDTLEQRMSRLSDWDDQFRAKYGEEGYLQLAAFMTKEGVVDAAALALALKSPRLAGKLVAETTDKLLTRFAKALGRASVMGVAGTGVQASIDSYLGFETDLPSEAGLRIGGAFVGEGVAKAIAATGRGIAGAAARLIDKGATLVGKQGHALASAGELTVADVISGTIPESVGDNILLDAMERLGLDELSRSSLAGSITEAAMGSNTAPYRALANQASASIRADKTGTLGNIFDLTESEINANLYGKTMKEEIMLHGVGNKLIGEKIVKQQEVDNILNYYFDTGVKQLARRPGELKGSTAPFRLNEWLSDGRNFIGDLADDLYDQHLNKDMYQKAFVEARQVIFKDLPEKSHIKAMAVREQLEEIAANDKNFVVNTTVLDRMGLNAAEQDAYWAQGKLLDFSAIVAETNMINNLTSKGYKQLADGRMVKVVEEGAEGMTKIRELGLNKQIEEVPTGDIKDVYRVMGYKKQAVPRRPKDAKYLAGTLDLETGQLSVTTASRYKSEMDQHMLDMDEQLGKSSKVAMYWRAGTDESSLGFGMSNNSVSLIDSLDEAGLAKLRQALEASGNTELATADIDNLRLAFDTLTHGSLVSQQIAGKRGAEGLKTVAGDSFEYLPAPEAITQHLMEVGALSYKDFRNDAIRKFEKEFAEVLDRSQGWDQPIQNVLGKADLVQRAQSVQAYIKRNVFNETPYGKEFRQGVDAMADRMRKAGGAQAQMVKSLEQMPVVEKALNLTRGGSTFLMRAPSAIVFAANVGSFLVQTAPSLALTMGAKGLTAPKHLVAGYTHMLGALAAHATKSGAVASKDSSKALQAIMKSGVLSREDFGDISRAAYGQSSTIYNKAMFFAQQGENVNKANVWFVTRAEMMDKVKKGELMNLGNTRLLDPSEIDSTEFLQIVSQKAKILHQDMTPAGRLRALTGAGDIIGKFTAPIIKMHTMFVSPSLSKGEKIGAAAGLISFFGIPALPAYMAIVAVADKGAEVLAGGDEIEDFDIVSKATENLGNHLLDSVGDLAGFTDEDKEFYRNTISKGLLYSLSEGELDLVNKMTIGLFISDATKYVEDPMAAIPMISILNKAADSASNIVQMAEDLYYASQDWETEDQKILDLRTFIGEVTDEMGSALPGFGKFVDILNNSPETRKYLKPELADKDPNGWVTRSGKRIKTDYEPTGMEKMLNVFGILPKPVQKNREVLKGQFDRVAILKDMKKTWVDRYKNAGTESARHRIMKEAMQEARDAERALQATYAGALSLAIGGGATTVYKGGALGSDWLYAMKRVSQERIAGNRTRSRGE